MWRAGEPQLVGLPHLARARGETARLSGEARASGGEQVMGYIGTKNSRVWIERTPARENNGDEFTDYTLEIEARHEIELDVDSREEITEEVIQNVIDEWLDEYEGEIEGLRVYEQKLIRA